jgi:hypothetical protein
MTTMDLDGRRPPQVDVVVEEDLRPLPPTISEVHERSVVTRAINSSVNNYCLRDNLAQSRSLVVGGAASGPSLLSAFDCMVFQFQVDLDALVADDVTFTITSATVPAPTPSRTTWRFYRNEIALAADDSAFDFTSTIHTTIFAVFFFFFLSASCFSSSSSPSCVRVCVCVCGTAEGLSFIMPNCMVTLATTWLFTITSSQSYMVTMAATYSTPSPFALMLARRSSALTLAGDDAASAPAEVALTEGVEFTGTWTTTNTWQLFSFVSDSEQAIQTCA